MAKKYYDKDIDLTVDWGGDENTENLPVAGSKVQKVIKESINSKIGYLGVVEGTGQGFYVLARDKETFDAYKETITDANPVGDINMDGIDGRRFDAPFNYKMDIKLLDPPSGYKSALLSSSGNSIKFTAETLDNNNTPQGESLTVTFKVITEGNVETSQTMIYDAKTATSGIEYDLDGKLGVGQNTIVINVVGMNTGVSAMRRITYRLIDMYINDSFDINKRYYFNEKGILPLTIGYSLKGIGRTKIVWYFDGSEYHTTQISNTNPNLSNASEEFIFTTLEHPWLTPGLHNIQLTMVCTDTESKEEFRTAVYYREFIVDDIVPNLEDPYITRKLTLDSVLEPGVIPTITGYKQFENIVLQYSSYYKGKSTCHVTTNIKYGKNDEFTVADENLKLLNDGFSDVKSQTVDLGEEGEAMITLRAYYYNSAEFIEAKYKLIIDSSDMSIQAVTDSIALSLNASGRTNDSASKDVWKYTYTEVGEVKEITATFSKDEYMVISTKDAEGNVIPPDKANESNTLTTPNLPSTEQKGYRYVKYNGEYYTWTRKFDWSNTSGWHDNKLKLSYGNAITIDYKPFSRDKTQTLKDRGGTYEFEFETTNVYNDDAVICRICGPNNFAPGISIYASGAELVVSREIDKPIYDEDGEIVNTNAGYIKAVSTKYKSEESNRISFVITPDKTQNDDGTKYRDRVLKIYVNGELCGAYPYDENTSFYNDSNIMFIGSEEACVNISAIQIYKRALSSNEILNNYIASRVNTVEKTSVYDRNNIMLKDDDETFDSDKLKSSLPVMIIYQTDPNQSLDDIHQEKKNKKLTRFFDVVYTDINNPDKNFLVKNAYITPQGTSSMNYPVKNLRLYTGKKNDKTKEYYSRLFVGKDIFKDGSNTNLKWENINLNSEVGGKRLYSFRNETESQLAAIPVNCWCLKADFAESSSSHNTGTARYWNNVLKTNGYMTKAQIKASQHTDAYPHDVRTAIDGFPIVVFYQPLNASAPRFEGKYNFNNDKSTESVFGFTGGSEIDDQEVKYFYIGKEQPIIHSEIDEETGETIWACDWSEGDYTETPTTDSPLYTSDDEDNWYMLRGKELLDNPKMECWELLNSVCDLALFKTAKGFGLDGDEEKVGIINGSKFEEAFESRYPDCGDYFHTNSLKRFIEWLVSCRYLDIDNETGESVPFMQVPSENYHLNNDGKLSICSLSKQTGEFMFDFPGYNFYREIEYEKIKTKIKFEGYQLINVKNEDIPELEKIAKVVEGSLPTEKDPDFTYLKFNNGFYAWLPSNLLVAETLPETHEIAYEYVQVGETYFYWANKFNFSDYYETQWVDDTAFNRAFKFAIEKYDHIEMNKMAAYYIYLMRFGGVDQTVKNSMLTTEGPASDDPNSDLPSLWYFINYDNDTILGVKNDGRLVFDPYITRQTKDGKGYVYAGRESTLWNNLEADLQFMEKVTEVDNVLTAGKSNPLFALSYNNAIREYDTNQSDKWCERIYNKDAERKYLDTYVKGWTQKVDKEGTSDHVYEDYLYDVHGSRSAHRKWWLGRRFNVFDSRFCNDNFKNSLVKFRSTNLPAGSSFTIKSGEPIFYAWGHDNAITEMTPNAIQPGDTHTFTTTSAFNIGSYIELMGSANLSTIDLRDCVGALDEIDITGCYSSTVGTKLKELLVGDHTRNNLINISNNLKFSGLDKATKLEVLDMTNITNATSFDGLNTLLNIREVYAKGTSVSNFTFADGCMIEKLELPATTAALSFTRSSAIDYENIVFENNDKSKLNNLTIIECAKLMNDPSFVLNWIASKTEAQRQNLVINLQGIDWVFNINNYNSLFLLESLTAANCNIGGTIEITERLNNSDVKRLKALFGEYCFNEGSTVHIKAPAGLYVSTPDVMWEGDTNIRCEITTVGTTSKGTLQVVATVDDAIIETTNGIITMDTTYLSRGYVTVNINESNNTFSYFILSASYIDSNGEIMEIGTSRIQKRIYPTSVSIYSEKDSYNNKATPNPIKATYTPSSINNLNLEGRGKFSVSWTMLSGSTDYDKKLKLTDTDKETAYIEAPTGFDGKVTLEVVITRNYDEIELCRNTTELEFTDPNTIITRKTNERLYNVLVSAGIIVEDASGFGKLTKQDASRLTMDAFIKDGKSIFADTNIRSFLEMQYFNGTLMGQMPKEGVAATLTPNGLFSGCTSLEQIAFPNSFKYTGNNMFSGCTNLQYIYGPQTGTDEAGKPVYSSLGFEYVGDNFAYRCNKLKQCMLSSVQYIGKRAFYECTALSDFRIPAIENLTIVNDTGNTAFEGCPSIVFTGPDYNDTTTTSKYKVKNGACYEVKQDNTLVLIHMGKNTLMTDIPTDKQVYAGPFSMEYRTEKNPVIPSNVIFNGDSILSNSKGNSITLTQILGSMNATGLFEKTDYNSYSFAPGETLIPADCFRDVTSSAIATLELPEGIVSIGNNAFRDCRGVIDLILPSTLTTIASTAFWSASRLKTIFFKSSMPPSFDPAPTNGTFRGVMLENIYMLPEYYNNYNNNIDALYKPIIKPKYAYEEGYLRIVKDGAILFPDGNNVIKVGNINVTEVVSDYMKYNGSTNTSPIVTLNGSEIGYIKEQYTTLYIGDNSSLYTGNGFDFTYGVYDDTILSNMNSAGWYYNAQYGGICSKKLTSTNSNTIMSFIMDSLKNTTFKVTYGIFTDENNEVEFIDSNGSVLAEDFGKYSGFNKNVTLTITGNTLKIKYLKAAITSTGMDGIVINKIGDTVFTDPFLPAVAMMSLDDDMSNTNIITVNLNAEQTIPNNVVVTVADGFAHTYRQLWNGEPLVFIVPKGFTYTVSATDFISANDKHFILVEEVNGVSSGAVELNYGTQTGMEIKNNVLCCYTPYTDFFVLLNRKTGKWSTTNSLIESVRIEDILLSDTDGFANTKEILKYEPENEIFNDAYNISDFGSEFKGYIPSYIEMQILTNELPAINNFLSSKGATPIDLSNCWTSDMYDASNAWLSDGTYLSKDVEAGYYVFGKRIML